MPPQDHCPGCGREYYATVAPMCESCTYQRTKEENAELRAKLQQAESERDAALARLGRHVAIADLESASYRIGFHNGRVQTLRKIEKMAEAFRVEVGRVEIDPN